MMNILMGAVAHNLTLPLAMMLLKIVGVSGVVTWVLNWQVFPIKQADGTTKKGDIIDLVPWPMIKPTVAGVISGLLYLGYNCITGDAFDANKLNAVIAQVCNDTTASGMLSVWFNNLHMQYRAAKEAKNAMPVPPAPVPVK